MANGLRLIPQALRVINAAAFTGTYIKLGTPLNFASCLIKFVNTSNVLTTISWDGVTDHDFFPPSSFSLYDVCSDAGSQRGLYVPAGTQFWVNGQAPGPNTGAFYLVVFNTSEF